MKCCKILLSIFDKINLYLPHCYTSLELGSGLSEMSKLPNVRYYLVLINE